MMNLHIFDISVLNAFKNRCPLCGQTAPDGTLVTIHDAAGMVCYIGCHACIRRDHAAALRARDHIAALLRVVCEPVSLAELDAICTQARAFLEGQ